MTFDGGTCGLEGWLSAKDHADGVYINRHTY